MPVSDEFLDHVRDRLAFLGSVRVRKMFGGAMVYKSDLPFALVADDTLYFRVGENNSAEFERAGTELFRPYAGKSMTMPYGEVPATVFDDDSLLGRWAEAAIDAARAARK